MKRNKRSDYTWDIFCNKELPRILPGAKVRVKKQLRHILAIINNDDDYDMRIVYKRWLKRGLWHYEIVSAYEFYLRFEYGIAEIVKEPKPSTNNLEPLSLFLEVDKPNGRTISLSRPSPQSEWCIKRSDGDILCKKPENGYYYFHILHVVGTDYLFGSLEEAYQFWLKNRPEILATNKELVEREISEEGE